MSKTLSTMLELGTVAPDFSLGDTEGNTVELADFSGASALLVIFMCNHCPYVKHLGSALAEFVQQYQPRGLQVVGINSNDADNYPDDAPEKMVEEKNIAGYTFPYLYDETQEVAKSYKAACTPDFFLFNKEQRLVYRGQFDDSRPGNNISITGNDLRAAVEALLAGSVVPEDQKPSMGCNIKWKPGNEPDYYN
ncbi:MAG: thioredoxin family protein [Gammaproteobacteria bacterium]|nr:MAG: thioredoxin family protein [Gammaproteobacteria bacterium]